MKRVAFKTLGCKVNQYDTEAMLESFERAGYTVVPFEEEAEVYGINTCTVTGTGDAKSVKLINRVHREHPNADIIVTGCLAQRDWRRVALPGVKLALGILNRARVVELYEREGFVQAVESLSGASFEELFVSRHEGKTRATMKIQEGCDRFCSYCVIPYVRGPVRSMPLASVVAEAKRLAEAGYREIVITGIHLASYGRGANDTLIDAVRAVCLTPGVSRVRLGSLEPKIITPEFARELSQLPGLCPQFHLSLQSGSAGVLNRMRRRYTPEEYEAAVLALREAFPGCAITTDVIAGFPGETEDEARETVEFVKKIGFARLHVFPYSRRAGTAADKLQNHVDEETKKRRADELINIGNILEKRYVQGLVGSVQTVLFEKSEDGLAEGFTPQYARVRAEARAGELAPVLITGAADTTLRGTRLMDDCLFCKIISGEIPCKKAYEDQEFLAFHDINPQAKTHILVIPKRHFKNVSEADADTLGKLFATAAKIAIEQNLTEGFRLVTNCGKHGAQSVPHLHVHILGGEQLGGDMRGK